MPSARVPERWYWALGRWALSIVEGSGGQCCGGPADCNVLSRPLGYVCADQASGKSVLGMFYE